MKREASRHLRNKKREYVKDKIDELCDLLFFLRCVAVLVIYVRNRIHRKIKQIRYSYILNMNNNGDRG
jgi:hypothetical protein